MRIFIWPFVAIALCGCDDGDSQSSQDGAGLDEGLVDEGLVDGGLVDGGLPDQGDATAVTYDPPPLPDFDAIPLPRTTDGQVIVTHIAGFTLRVAPDTITPEARAGRCAFTLIACLKATAGDHDACMASTPVCATAEYDDPSTPACCPAGCAGAYAQARAAGAAPLDAVDQALFGAASCIPGMEE